MGRSIQAKCSGDNGRFVMISTQTMHIIGFRVRVRPKKKLKKRMALHKTVFSAGVVRLRFRCIVLQLPA